MHQLLLFILSILTFLSRYSKVDGLKMGALFSFLFGKRVKHMKILMVGLDNAGKTSILYKLKMGGLKPDINPTLGFNTETIRIKNTNYTIREVGGQARIRPLWKHYFPEAQGLVFVVDSTDVKKLEEVKVELWSLFYETELKGIPLLVLANKQDLPDAMSQHELSKQLNLFDITERQWIILPCCGLPGETQLLQEIQLGLKWLKSPLKETSFKGINKIIHI